jgi:N-acetylglucosaminyldiphosphoundecaprenol N-acetyl-beta-D-mannosaminyltransferase
VTQNWLLRARLATSLWQMAYRLFGRLELWANVPERGAGIDLMVQLLAAAEANGLSVYFLGAKREVVGRLVERCRARHPKIKIAGFRDSYFRPSDHQTIIEEVRASGTHMLFVGMPSPFKET